jgi:glycosyltransferase involved in cell wall biosynthesis
MKVLLVYNTRSSFVLRDLEILRAAHATRDVYLRAGSGRNYGRLLRAIAWADVVVCWFAGVHAFLSLVPAKALAKRTIVITGGYDVASEPRFGYGSMRGGPRRLLGRLTLKMADRIAAVSRFNAREAIENGGASPDKLTVVYHGFDSEEFGAVVTGKERVVLTVGAIDAMTLWRKGHALFVRAASHLPEVPFVLAGGWQDGSVDILRRQAPPNVSIVGRLEQTSLLDYLNRAKVYVQASGHEAFGLSLAEAMLCRCVPVVTTVAALPEVVGDSGVYVSESDPGVLAEGIRRALDAPEDLGEKARERIIQQFPLSARREALLSMIEEVAAA